MKLKDKLEEFIETHEFEIGVAAGVVACVAGVAVTCVAGKCMTRGIKDLPVPEMEIGKITMLWDEWWNKNAREKCANAIVTDLTIADLGRFGNELTKIEGVKLDSPVQLVVTALMK